MTAVSAWPGFVVQLARDATALFLLGQDDLGGKPLGLLGLLANRRRVGLQAIPQGVDLEDEAGHVGVGQGRHAGARRVVASIEALGRLAQRADRAERFSQQQHAQAGRQATARPGRAGHA